MLIRDYSGFGMMGHDTGRDCPVPSSKIPSVAEMNAWCDCAYADPKLNKQCKTHYRPDDTMKLAPFPAPWTGAPLCGAAVRGLPLNNGGMLCDAAVAIGNMVRGFVEQEGGKLVSGATGGGGTSSTQPTAQTTQPAQVLPTQPGTGTRLISTSRYSVNADIKGRFIKGADQLAREAEAYIPPVVREAGMGGMGLVVALAAGAFLLPKLLKPKAPMLSGYSRRSRRRRR